MPDRVLGSVTNSSVNVGLNILQRKMTGVEIAASQKRTGYAAEEGNEQDVREITTEPDRAPAVREALTEDAGST